ncbi:hypothetical protein [Aquabacterium sp.]|uniref:hypothetical protein n=1 Tax=Aquabacterium sp. TaxID=1872578 RepID=UPI0025C0DA53|nr:hypothetical protein [Aquabacterium sp.]
MKGGMRFGAGRPGWHMKAEHCRRIDVHRFKREGMLRPGSWGWSWRDSETGKVLASIGVIGGHDRITLEYSVGGTPITEHINITRTACAYGGSRPWFNCPKCWDRVAVLYLRQSRFACRKCQRLVYASQSEDALGRTWRKQSKLEARLGENWSRPKGMHRKTRERILEAIWECEGIRDDALAEFAARLGFRL